MDARSIALRQYRFIDLPFVMLCMVLPVIWASNASACGTSSPTKTFSTSLQVSPDSKRDVENRPVPPTSEPQVRIRLRSKDLKSSVTFGETGQQLLCFHEADSRIYLRSAPLEITHVNAGWRLLDGKRKTTQLLGSGILSIRTLVGSDSRIFFEERRLPGFVDLVPLTSSGDSTMDERLDVIVYVSLESYLPGVLDVELYGHWPLETFQAQAIAARSYALAESAFWATRRHFDLIAGPESQGWSGDGGSDKARKAVQRTAGMVLVHEGRVIPAYYSAACGGVPASADDAISSRESHRISPLVPMDSRPVGCCEASSVREWQAEFKRDDLDRALRIWQQSDRTADATSRSNLRGSFDAMTVLERSPTGRPLVYGLVTSRGESLRIGSESFRRLLSKLPRIEKGTASSLRSSVFKGEFRGTRFLIKGLGWGHGCGLCQYGANAMGKDGATWRTILERYYPGSEIQAAWEVEDGPGSQSERPTMGE